MPEHPEYPELMTRDLPAGLTLIDGGVTAARGFRAGNTACGIKSDAGLPDLAMLVADTPCAAAGTFTTSKTASHTVLLDREHLAATGGHAQAVVVNSGNANCSNGEQGMLDARRMADVTAQKLGIDPSQVLGQLAQHLPDVVNHLTPNGEVPAGSSGFNLSELSGFASKLGL